VSARVIEAAHRFWQIQPRSDNETDAESAALDFAEVKETYLLFCKIIERKDNESHLTPMKYMLRHLLIHHFGVPGAALDEEAETLTFPGLAYAYDRMESCLETLMELSQNVEKCEDKSGAYFAFPASLLLQELVGCEML